MKAISVRRGLVDSLVSTSSITLLDLVIPPAISPAPGPYSELVEVWNPVAPSRPTHRPISAPRRAFLTPFTRRASPLSSLSRYTRK